MHLLARLLVRQQGGPVNIVYFQRTTSPHKPGRTTSPHKPGRHRRHSRHLDTLFVAALFVAALSVLGVGLSVWAVLS